MATRRPFVLAKPVSVGRSPARPRGVGFFDRVWYALAFDIWGALLSSDVGPWACGTLPSDIRFKGSLQGWFQIVNISQSNINIRHPFILGP